MRESATAAIGLAILFALVPSIACAGWTPEGVSVRATTNTIPRIEACPDGAHGAIVAWQEDSTGGGILRAQHLLASGDPDPTWPTEGLVVCSTPIVRSSLGVLSDDLGGAYIWWMEGAVSNLSRNDLFLTRVDASGQVASNWPARGRLLGQLYQWGCPMPTVIADGSNGVYLAWLNYQPGGVQAIHLGPGNTGAGGWPNAIRDVIPPNSIPSGENYPRLALAPDGGVFLAWANWSLDTLVVPNVFRLTRLGSDGATAAGWPAQGYPLGRFHVETLEWYELPPGWLIGLDADGRGGVFLLTADPYKSGSWISATTTLYRLQGDGSTAPDWPAAGRSTYPDEYGDVASDREYGREVVSDGSDGALVGYAAYATEGVSIYYHDRIDAAGQLSYHVTGGNLYGQEFAVAEDGRAFVATFKRESHAHIHDNQDAYLSLVQTDPPPGWQDFYAGYSEWFVLWFTDLGLTLTEDGGAILFWSQSHERFGLFARRFTSTGELTAVGPGATAAPLRALRFVAGVGVRASVTVRDGAPARFDLFDLAGRRLATQALAAGSGPAEITLAGTGALGSGLYFARLITGAEVALGRVVVTR